MAIASTQQSTSNATRAWEAYRSLYDMFLATVKRQPQHVALRAKQNSPTYNVSFTYQELADMVRQVAAALVDAGVAPGDRIAIASANRPEWVMMDLGAFGAGAADVPLYPTLTGDQMAYILNDSGARFLAVSNEAMLKKLLDVEDKIPNVGHVVCFDASTSRPKRMRFWTWDELLSHGREQLKQHADELDKRQTEVQPDALASIVYTSGTTGEPKGAMLRHRNFLSNAVTAANIIDLTPEDVQLSFLPLCHVFERIIYYVMLYTGCSIAYAESIDAVPQNLLEVRPSLVPSVPSLFEKTYARIMEGVEQQPRTMRRIFNAGLSLGRRYQQLKAEGKPVPPLMELEYRLAKKVAFKRIYARTGGNIKYFVSGGAPLRKDIGEFFLAVGLKIIEGYGLTETSPVITFNPPEKLKFGTVGKPIDGVECKIADDGEIIARGPNIMQGYFNKPEATREAIDGEGWFHTGDIGMFDSEGYLVITDRKKELLVLSNGKKVAPQPIENSLKASNYIEQAMILGDNRQFVGALLVPAFDAVKRWAAAEGGVTLGEPSTWDQNDKVRQLLTAEVEKVNKGLAQYEKVKQFAILDREFSQDKNELTPTLKFKRKIILEHYKDTVERIYSAAPPEDGGKKESHG